jgi:hypothetical protein
MRYHFLRQSYTVYSKQHEMKNVEKTPRLFNIFQSANKNNYRNSVTVPVSVLVVPSTWAMITSHV